MRTSALDWPEACVDCGATECSCVEDAQTMRAHDMALAICAELLPPMYPHRPHTREYFSGHEPVRTEWFQKYGYGYNTDAILDRLLAWIRWPGVDPLVEPTARIAAAIDMSVAATRESAIACMQAFDVDTTPEPEHPLPWTHTERLAITTVVCAKCHGSGWLLPETTTREGRPGVFGIDACGGHSNGTNWAGVLVVMDWLTKNGAWTLVHEWRPTVEIPPDSKDARALSLWAAQKGHALDQLDSVTVDPELRLACERVQHMEGGTLADAARWLARCEWRWEGDDLMVEIPSECQVIDDDEPSPFIRVSNHWRTYPPPSCFYNRRESGF